MPSIRALLDTFGHPPSEISLDWYWQIRAQSEKGSLRTDDQLALSPDSDVSATSTDEWTALNVMSDGTLELVGLSKSAAELALADLRTWIDQSQAMRSEHEPGASRSAHESHLQFGDLLQRTGVAANHTSSLGMTALTARTADVHSTESTDHSFSARPAKLKHRAKSPPSRSATKSSSIHIALSRLQLMQDDLHNIFANPRKRLIAFIIGSGCFIAVAGVAAVLTSTWSTSTATPPQALAHDEHAAHEEFALDSSKLNSELALDAKGPASDQALMSGQGANAAKIQPVESVEPTASPLPLAVTELAPQLKLPSQAGVDALTTSLAHDGATLASPKAEVDDTVFAATTSRSESASTANLSGSRGDGASNKVDDVMQQVATAVARAQEQTQAQVAKAPDESDLASSSNDASSSGDGLHQPAITLKRDQLMFRLDPPKAHRERVREPHWVVRIASSDGFVAEPDTAQTVRPRAGGLWRIFDQDAPSPRACIVVQLLNRGGRSAGLDGLLVGGSEDLPELRLPLGRKWLDPLRVQLKLSATNLRSLSELSTQLVPSELRSLVQTQRRQAAEQLKVADRLLAVVADVDRLASLLDGEIECHAELREGADGEAIARFGE